MKKADESAAVSAIIVTGAPCTAFCKTPVKECVAGTLVSRY